MSPLRTTAVRFLTALHAALGRWLALTVVPEVRRKHTSWFGCDADTIHAALPRDPDEEEADAWHRTHFRINGQPLP
jgi:hypothetical protein